MTENVWIHGFGKGNKHGRGRGAKPDRRDQLVDSGYTDEELEFMLAIDNWLLEHPGKLRPADDEVLAIARSLGWRKD